MTDTRELVGRLRDYVDAYPEDLFPPLTMEEKQQTMALPGLFARGCATLGRRFGKDAGAAADTIERLQRERKEVLTLGRECELSITGDPYEESAVTTHEIAMQAIREALRLGLERNNEANALRTELAARDKTIETLREDAGRYRWLRSADSAVAEVCNSATPKGDGFVFMEGVELDAAIDAARSEGEKP